MSDVIRKPLATLKALEQQGSLDFVLDEKNSMKTGFLIYYEEAVYAYLNQCPHTKVELNWMPNQFMDVENRFVQCATHGALFEPASGECIHGPCLGQYLEKIEIEIESGKIYLKTA